MNSFRNAVDSYTHGNAAQVGACGGAEDVTKRSGDRYVNWDVAIPFSHRPPHRASGALPAMSSQHETVSRARALRGRLLAIAAACASAGVPLPMRRELARLTGATERQIHRSISYLRDIGRIEIERRQNRAWVQGVVQ